MHWLKNPEEVARRLKDTWQIDLKTAPTAENAIATLLIVAGVFLFLGGYLMATREFRVKTPEGN